MYNRGQGLRQVAPSTSRINEVQIIADDCGSVCKNKVCDPCMTEQERVLTVPHLIHDCQISVRNQFTQEILL